MFRTATQNRIGYGVLALGVVAGLIGGFINDAAIKGVNKKQTEFIIRQCDRESFRNSIAISFLERDKTRVEQEKNLDPAVKSVYLSTIDYQITTLNKIPPCRLP